jgi:hypothetical protein
MPHRPIYPTLHRPLYPTPRRPHPCVLHAHAALFSYARAVAGTFVKQEFDLDTGVFAVTYKVAAAGAGGLQSEVYVNSEYHYPNGYSVAFKPSGCCSWAMASKVLMIIRCVPSTTFACRVLTRAASHSPTVAPASEITVFITANSQQLE